MKDPVISGGRVAGGFTHRGTHSGLGAGVPASGSRERDAGSSARTLDHRPDALRRLHETRLVRGP